jgi:hypothetical protein
VSDDRGPARHQLDHVSYHPPARPTSRQVLSNSCSRATSRADERGACTRIEHARLSSVCRPVAGDVSAANGRRDWLAGSTFATAAAPAAVVGLLGAAGILLFVVLLALPYELGFSVKLGATYRGHRPSRP